MAEAEAGPVSEVERWLEHRGEEVDEHPIFWAPHAFHVDDWRRVDSVEQLAVHVSTAIRRDNNVCFASGAPYRAGRSASFIGLLGRESQVWAVNLWHRDEDLVGDVRRADYPHDNYDSFGALTAAQIAVAWIRFGIVPEGLVLRRRH